MLIIKKIRYNSDFLPELIRRITAHGRGTKTMIVDAMNNPEEKKKATLTSLDRWISGEKPIPVNRIVNLVNNMEDVTLADFFVFDDGQPVEVRMEKQSPAPSVPDENTSTELLSERIRHLQELDAVKTEARRKEDQLRKEYEQRLANERLLMQRTIDLQADTIRDLRRQLKDPYLRPDTDEGHNTYAMASDPLLPPDK